MINFKIKAIFSFTSPRMIIYFFDNFLFFKKIF